MSKRFVRVLGMAAGAAMFVAGSAVALDSSFDAMSQSGTHQFYVWCTGADDYEKTQDGASAKDAQAALAASVGGTCWPVWQGLVN